MWRTEWEWMKIITFFLTFGHTVSHHRQFANVFLKQNTRKMVQFYSDRPRIPHTIPQQMVSGNVWIEINWANIGTTNVYGNKPHRPDPQEWFRIKVALAIPTQIDDLSVCICPTQICVYHIVGPCIIERWHQPHAPTQRENVPKTQIYLPRLGFDKIITSFRHFARNKTN